MTSVLITGNTGLLSQELFNALTEENKVVVTVDNRREEAVGKQGNLYIYKTAPGEEKFRWLFDAYHFEIVLYISGYADCCEGFSQEHKWVENLFACCKEYSVGKFILISTVESRGYASMLGRNGELLNKEYDNQKAFSASQLEEWCSYLAGAADIKLITLLCQYFAGEDCCEGLIRRIFDRMENDCESIDLPHTRDCECDFISMSDLGRLLVQIFQETEDKSGEYYLVSGYRHRWSDVSSALTAVKPDISVEYTGGYSSIELPDYPYELRRLYGFVPMDDVLSDFSRLYEAYRRSADQNKPNFFSKARQWLLKHIKSPLKYIELTTLFFFTEFLAGYTSTSVYFKVFDVRLLFIVIMATIYGLHVGLVAALLECVVFAHKWMESGVDGIALLYNIENWIPFVLYIMTGSIIGYIVDKRTKETEFNCKEMEILRDKYSFLNRIYQGVLQNRSEYRHQILGLQDSFGKIFKAVQNLDSEISGRVLMKGLAVMENVLNNHSIAIYTLDDWQKFGRLVVCSNSMLSRLTKSLRISDYQQMYDTISAGEVFSNIEFKDGWPACAYGVKRGDKIAFLVLIWELSAEQYGIYYTNLFHILCGLMQTSFMRAKEFEELTHERIYYSGTQIARPECFRNNLQIQVDMRDAGMSDFMLVKFRSRSISELNEKLVGVIRATDLVGTDEDGVVYLMLPQMRPQSFSVVGKRLDERGVEYDIVDGME